MRNKIIFIICLCIVAACSLQKEVKYNMPNGLTENQKTKFLENFNNGSAVYTISCAKCHDKTVNNQIVKPEFTQEQLELYIVRIQNDEHSKNLTIRDISDEDLQRVMFYLKYKIKKMEPKN